MLHIRDVEGPKKTGSVETRLKAMEQQVFKCQGMVERGLNANHMMITEFTSNHKMDAIDIGKHLSRLYDMVDQLHGQIYDLQNQNSQTFLPSFPVYVHKKLAPAMVSVGGHGGYSDADDAVDFRGNPVDKSKTGGWLGAGLILACFNL
ncbi:40S ribosomal protein S5-1 [Hordeum vulgare]|nr:40S ribosomal protein S5-1 [Hordeum vulgare]